MAITFPIRGGMIGRGSGQSLSLGGLGTVPFEEFLHQQSSLVMETLPQSLRRLMVGCLNEMCIGLEFDWISHHDFCDRHLGVKYESGRLERIRLWSEIAKSCYWWAPYETTCVVSHRPTEIHLDARERLHNVRGPAMAFSEGWSLYSIHGSFVSERRARTGPLRRAGKLFGLKPGSNSAFAKRPLSVLIRFRIENGNSGLYVP